MGLWTYCALGGVAGAVVFVALQLFRARPELPPPPCKPCPRRLSAPCESECVDMLIDTDWGPPQATCTHPEHRLEQGSGDEELIICRCSR